MDIDSTKPKPSVPVAAPPPDKKDAKSEAKPALKLDFVPTGPKPDYKAIFDTGVTGIVFGNKSPVLGTMSDGELVAKSNAMIEAAKKNPAKMKDADFRLLGEMQKEILFRAAAKLGTDKAPDKMSNQELMGTLMAYDLAKASGVPLTPNQTAWLQGAEKVWKERVSVDPDKKLLEIADRYRETLKEARIKCGAGALATAGLVTHTELLGGLSSGVLLFDAIGKKDWLGATKEAITFGASHLPYGKGIELIGLASTAAECKDALYELAFLKSEQAVYEQKAKEKKP